MARVYRGSNAICKWRPVLNIIDTAYNTISRLTGRAGRYQVTLKHSDTGELTTVDVTAATIDDAVNRALAQATNQPPDGKSEAPDVVDRSFGVLLGSSHYKPTSISRAVTSPFAIWRDPVFKRSLKASSRASTLKPGSLVRMSHKALLAGDRINQGPSPTRRNIQKAININIVALLAWLGILIISISAGAHTVNTFDNTPLVHLLPFIIGTVLGSAASLLGMMQSRRNLACLAKELQRLDRDKI